MQYILKKMYKDDFPDDLHSQVDKLFKCVSIKENDLEIFETKVTEANASYQKHRGMLDEIENDSQGSGDLFKEQFKAILDEAEKKVTEFKENTVKLRKQHEDMCVFYRVDKNDDMNKKSEEFFKIFVSLFKQMQQALPKEVKKGKGGPASKGGMNVDMLAELKAK